MKNCWTAKFSTFKPGRNKIGVSIFRRFRNFQGHLYFFVFLIVFERNSKFQVKEVSNHVGPKSIFRRYFTIICFEETYRSVTRTIAFLKIIQLFKQLSNNFSKLFQVCKSRESPCVSVKNYESVILTDHVILRRNCGKDGGGEIGEPVSKTSAQRVLPRKRGAPIRILCRSSGLMQRSIIPVCPRTNLLSLYRVIVCQISAISFFLFFFFLSFFFFFLLHRLLRTPDSYRVIFLRERMLIDGNERRPRPSMRFPPDVEIFRFQPGLRVLRKGNASRSFEQSVVCPLNPRMHDRYHFTTHVFPHAFANRTRLTGDSNFYF